MAFVWGTLFAELQIARASCVLHPRPLSHAAAKALEQPERKPGTGTGDEAGTQEMMTLRDGVAGEKLQLFELENAVVRSSSKV